jgi:copper transport protein
VRGLAAALWLLVLLPCPVAAHAVLVEAQPADGQQLDQAPAELTLRFSEPVVPISVRLLDARGAELSANGLEPRGDTLVLRPAGLLPQGAYLLSYRVTSVDGHPVGAAIRFGIGVRASAGTSGAEARARWPAAAARWLVYLTALAATAWACSWRPCVRRSRWVVARTGSLRHWHPWAWWPCCSASGPPGST